MSFFSSTLFYLLIMATAFICLGMIFSPKSNTPLGTKIVPTEAEPSTLPATRTVSIKALKNGEIQIERRLNIAPGDTVNLVITKFDNHVKIVEKKGLQGIGEECCHRCIASVHYIPQRWYAYRYESEITGEWCTFEFTNLEGNSEDVEMRL